MNPRSLMEAVEATLREARRPMRLTEIRRVAAPRLSAKARVPGGFLTREIARDLQRKGSRSVFVRIAFGLYTLRELVPHMESLTVKRAPRRRSRRARAKTPKGAKAP